MDGASRPMLLLAARYWRAARAALIDAARPNRLNEPAAHLLGVAAELTLKTFLVNNGVQNRTLRAHNMRHNSALLLELAVERGFSISTEEAGALCVLGIAHLDHFYRYGIEGAIVGDVRYLLSDDAALSLVARIIDRVGEDPTVLRRVHLDEDRFVEWPMTEPIFGVSAHQVTQINQIAIAEANAASATSPPIQSTMPDQRSS